MKTVITFFSVNMKKHYCHENFFLLSLLKKLKPAEREKVIYHLNDKAIDALSECVYNIISQTTKIEEKTKKRLRKALYQNKDKLRIIADKKISVKKRRKALSQGGGFLGTAIAKQLQEHLVQI